MSANVPGVLTGPAAQPAVPWEASEGGPFALGVSGEGTWPAQGGALVLGELPASGNRGSADRAEMLGTP